jgi:hypothetical protein
MKKIFLLFIFVCFGSFLFGYDWPVKEGPVTATFGESRGDHFHDGIDIGGGPQEIYPVENGEVIFYFNEENLYDDIPTGLGTFLLLEHPRQYRSLYAHLDSVFIEDGGGVSADEPLGIMGDTGYSLGIHLHFSLMDRKLERKVNPQLLLPKRKDPRKPSIGNVYLGSSEKKIIIQNDTRIPSGEWMLSAEIYDGSHETEYFCPLAPYEIFLLVNGREHTRIRYDSLMEEAGRLILHPGNSLPAENFYLDGWEVALGKIEINHNPLLVDLIVTDITGNETRRRFNLEGVGDENR